MTEKTYREGHDMIPIDLVSKIATRMGATLADTVGGRKFKGAVNARAACSIVLRRLGWSLWDITPLLGYSDHSSVVHAVGVAVDRERESLGFRDTTAFGLELGREAGLQRESGQPREPGRTPVGDGFPQHGMAPLNRRCSCGPCKASLAGEMAVVA